MRSSERTFDKPWIIRWLRALETLPPIEQTIGLWMAYLADKQGRVDDLDWYELAELCGVFQETPKKVLRRDDCMLTSLGLLSREVRMARRAYMTPKITLHPPEPDEDEAENEAA